MFDAPDPAGAARWPVVRISVGGRCRVITLGSAFLPLSVHWVGHSIPCSRKQCALCEALPVRALFYLPVACQGRTSIFEVSSTASANIEQHCKLLHGGLRPGLELDVLRRSAKSPLYGEVVGEHSSTSEVPLLLFASRVMALYHLPCANPQETLEAYQVRLHKICAVRNERLAQQLVEKAATSGRGL